MYSLQTEEREQFRLAVDCTVSVKMDDGFITSGKVENLSTSGILFATDLQPAVGEYLSLDIYLLGDNDEPLSVRAEVVRSSPSDNKQYPHSVACWITYL